jgi:predicted homoserine dehydrogenase-like protein
MLEELREREREGRPIRVGLIGAGAMGRGIAWQVGRTPGMQLVFVADLRREAAKRAAHAHGGAPAVADDALAAIDRFPVDVLVESTSSIGAAARYGLAAIARGSHVVLMNAEVDLALGPLLLRAARANGVVVTSDAGDQHGVLARMLEEIVLWGFEIVQAGNIKGFLDRHATAAALVDEARARNLDPVQCCAYTDGTKLNIEMALVANGWGLLPTRPGMEGPRCADVRETLACFDLDGYDGRGRIDYVLGAEPGGGVYVIGRCDDPDQAAYLRYYKLHGRHPYYLFYRPYHLCHLETTRAIALAALWRKAVLTPRHGRLTDVYAHAKKDLAAGEVFTHGIGGDQAYGLVAAVADAPRQTPIALLEPGRTLARMRRARRRDEPIELEDVDLPDGDLVPLHREAVG